MRHDVTILLLVCNRDNFLAEALASVRSQTHTAWQLIVSDGSTDAACRARIAEIFSEHEKLSPSTSASQLIQQPRPLLQGEHLGAVWSLVNTEFLALLDDDDAWLPHQLERTISWLRENRAHGLAMSNSFIVDAEGNRHGTSNAIDASPVASVSPEPWLRYLLSSPFSSMSGYVFRSECVRSHRFINTSCVDVHLTVTALLNGAQTIAFPEPGFLYRRHAASAYAKGDTVFVDRHRFRLHLGVRHFFALTRRVPTFPLLLAKSFLALAARALRPEKT